MGLVTGSGSAPESARGGAGSADPFNAHDGVANAVEALPAGWAGQYFAAVDSTQDEARAAARQGAPSRSIVVADFQRAGRGRQGRVWLAEPGDALLMSVLFRDSTPAPAPLRWTSLAAVALVEAIDEVAPGLHPAIKWPNDVLLGDRKVADILAETTWDGQELVAIVGVGLNVNTSPADMQPLQRAVTSLRAASGQRVNRTHLLHAFVRHMDTWLEQTSAVLSTAWQAHLWGRGQRLRLVDLDLDDLVVVLGVDPDGALRVRLPDGTVHRTTTAELIL